MRKAVIDLGSDACRLVVADVDGPTVTPVLRDKVAFTMTHTNSAIPKHVITELVDTVRALVRHANDANAELIRVIAAAALRDATNCDTVVAAIRAATGVGVDVLSPHAEGQYAFLGVTHAASPRTTACTVLDLGGRSLEIITGVTHTDVNVSSVPLGVNQMMRHVTTDPLAPGEHHAIVDAITAELATVSDEITTPVLLTGGAINVLATLLHTRNAPVSTAALGELADELMRVRTIDWRERGDIPAHRANQIHVAAVIWHTVLTHFAVDSFTVHSSGVRTGVLVEPRRPKVRTLTHVYRRHVDATSVGQRVSIRHLLTDDTHGTTPTDVVGRLASFDDDMALVIDRHGTLHIIDTAMILASRVIPTHPTRAPEPVVGTKDAPVERDAARAVILTPDGLLLVAHHPEASKTVWTAPGGGMNVGETGEDTVRREVREELGVDVTVGAVFFHRVAEFAFRGVWLRQHETWFLAELNEPFTLSDAPLNDASTSAVRAFTFDELLAARDAIAPDDLIERVAGLFTSESPQDGAP